MNKLLRSSANPTQLSLTIKGLLTGLIPVFILLAQFKGVSLSEIEVNTVIDSIGAIFMTITAVVSAITTFVGLARKLINKFTQ